MTLSRTRVFQIGSLVVDAAISESHERSASVTKHPVEKGSDFSDHIKLENDVLSVEGIVSDTPIGQVAELRKSQSLQPAGQPGSTTRSSYSDEALKYLDDLFRKKQTVSIETSIGTYQNMVCTSLSFPRDASTGYSLQFSATFEELHVIENARVRVSVPRAHGKNRRGFLSGIPGFMQKLYGRALTQRLLDETFPRFKEKRILWRKGSPPGAPGDHLPTEVITLTSRSDHPGVIWIWHADGQTQLTKAERLAWHKDDKRDREARNLAAGRTADGQLTGDYIDGVVRIKTPKDAMPSPGPQRSYPAPDYEAFGRKPPKTFQ